MNQRLHVICVPAIVWSLLAILHALPLPDGLADRLPQGVWAGLATLLALFFWWRLSRPLALGSAVFAALGLWGNVVILENFGAMVLLIAGIAVFVLAWIGQFIGHLVEGRRPSFFTDLVYLMIGPPWVLAKAYRAIGLGW